MDRNALEARLGEFPLYSYDFLDPKELEFSDRIRWICEHECPMYGKTWACPPAVGTVKECRARCLAYKTAMVFSAVYPLEDSFDYEGMLQGHSAFKDLCDRLYERVKPQLHQFLLLSGCHSCKNRIILDFFFRI